MRRARQLVPEASPLEEVPGGLNVVPVGALGQLGSMLKLSQVHAAEVDPGRAVGPVPSGHPHPRPVAQCVQSYFGRPFVLRECWMDL